MSVIPDYQTLLLPLLKIAAEQETKIPDIENRVADLFELSDAERSQLLPSGRQKVLHNRLHWTKFYLTKAGLLDIPGRGRFVASAAGRELLTKNPKNLDVEQLLSIPAFREYYERTSENGSTESQKAKDTPGQAVRATPEEQIDSAHLALGEALRSDLLQRVLQNSPAFFENLIVELLVAMGYGGSHKNASQQLGRSGDGGVDGVLNEDTLGLDRVYVQAKRYAESSSIGRPDVQGFVGSLVGLGATKGVFVTTSTFSAQAKEYAKHLTQRVILIDGKRLTDLMVEHNVGVRTNRTLEFKRIDEDFFSEDD